MVLMYNISYYIICLYSIHIEIMHKYIHDIYTSICAKCMVYGCTVTYIYVHKSALRLIWCPECSVNMHVCNLGQTVNKIKFRYLYKSIP